nr:tryptophan--tRNA ligase [Elusimicrobiota bacterium]
SDMAVLGFLGYPVLQAADVLLYDARYVPIGKDQLPHLEISRDVARRFNHVFGSDLMCEPEPLFTSSPSVPGLDGRKMSKSYGNAILLGEETKSLQKKINSMYTDPLKVHLADKGHPEGCVVCAFHKLYNPDWKRQHEACSSGATGCGACKKMLFELMEGEIGAFRVRRAALADDGKVDAVLAAGAAKAAAVADRKVKAASKAAGLA